MRHANDGFVTEDIKAHKKTVYEKTNNELKSLGFASNEIELIQKKIIPKHIRQHEEIFHCDFQTRAKVKSECKELYRRIMITRYRRLRDFLEN